MAHHGDGYELGPQLSDEEVAALWLRFVEERGDNLRDRLIEHYMPLVYQTAQRMAAKLPSHVDVEDLMGAGCLGLIDAINRFDPTRDVKFSTYCSTRISGSIFDELRRLDWAPRLVRSRVNQLQRCREELESALGRPPSDEELAEYMDMSREEFEALQKETQVKSMVSLDRKWDEDDDNGLAQMETMADTRAPDPLAIISRRELKEIAIRGLCDKEKQILVMYYYDNMSLKEIGAVLGLSESRVCQIHAKMIQFLRDKFQQREIVPVEE